MAITIKYPEFGPLLRPYRRMEVPRGFAPDSVMTQTERANTADGVTIFSGQPIMLDAGGRWTNDFSDWDGAAQTDTQIFFAFQDSDDPDVHAAGMGSDGGVLVGYASYGQFRLETAFFAHPEYKGAYGNPSGTALDLETDYVDDNGDAVDLSALSYADYKASVPLSVIAEKATGHGVLVPQELVAGQPVVAVVAVGGVVDRINEFSNIDNKKGSTKALIIQTGVAKATGTPAT